MEDLEILAELKEAYELLEDIIENADNTQLKSIKELQNIQGILSTKYEEIYDKIKNENDISLYYEENIKISPYIYYDYIGSSKNYINAGDLNWNKWWEDISFLKNFN